MYSQNPQGQNFYQVRATCAQYGTLFEDNEFPPVNRSLYVSGADRHLSRVGPVTWKRPFELSNQPKFYADGVSRHDVIQGELGNCWFIAAVSNLTLHQNLFVQVVPQDNTFERGQYCGAFHFRFWTFGRWVEIVIDDRLPCNSRGQLLFMQSQDKSEFWSCLLEKAYAKFHGSYESLSGGIASEAMQDFSGGIIEMIDIQETQWKNVNNQSELFSVMSKAQDRASLMTCALHNQAGRIGETRTGQGLVAGHAYSITGVCEVSVYNGAQIAQLVRIRNPWGDFEWNGAWSDSSREWGMVDAGTKARLGLVKRNDGEFWMNVEDFQDHFHRLEICHLSPDPVNDVKLSNPAQQNFIPWKRMAFEGAWIPGQTAGGCMNHNTFATNPQYFFDFTASSVDGSADKCTVVVSLIQQTASRSYTRKEGLGKSCIGFRMFRIPRYTGLMDMSFFKHERSLGSGSYINSREISARFEVATGTYVIVPSTFEPNMGGNFLLRIFSEPPAPQMAPQQAYPHPQQQQQWGAPPPPVQYAAPPQYPPMAPPPQYAQQPPQYPPAQQSMMGGYPPSYGVPPAQPLPPTGPPPGAGPGFGWNL